MCTVTVTLANAEAANATLSAQKSDVRSAVAQRDPLDRRRRGRVRLHRLRRGVGAAARRASAWIGIVITARITARISTAVRQPNRDEQRGLERHEDGAREAGDEGHGQERAVAVPGEPLHDRGERGIVQRHRHRESHAAPDEVQHAARCRSGTTRTSARRPGTIPRVISPRGPLWSSHRPTGIAAAALTARASENAPVTATGEARRSRSIAWRNTGNP